MTSRSRLGAAAAMSAGCGLSLLVAFPPYDWWWLAPVGVALLAVAVRGRSVRVGGVLGLVAGLTLFVPLLSFTGLQVGWWPWLLLAAVQASFLALLGATGAYVSALVDRVRWAWPLTTAVLWVGQEALRSRVPFGGFPWGRLAFSQADAPVLSLASWGGAPAVTFAVALAGGLSAALIGDLMDQQAAGRRRVARSVLTGAAAIAVMLGGVLVPLDRPGGRPVLVAVVQGNVPRTGLDFNAQRRAVLDNHVEATLKLAESLRSAGRPRPDIVVWPENASDIDPLINADAAARIDAAAAAIAAPILVGAVLRGPGPGKVRNASLLWPPQGGPTISYIKRHPVPFAEYVPLRSLVRRVTTLVDRVRADFIAGDTPGVTTAAGIRIGTVICFEVAYDDLVRDMTVGGAEILAVQTNNATFNYAEATQQLAMVRLRAVEHGRPALMASTVGVSAFVAADGSVSDATAMNTQAVILRILTTGQGSTLATRTGAAAEWLLVGMACTVLVASGWARRARHRSSGPWPSQSATGGGSTASTTLDHPRARPATPSRPSHGSTSSAEYSD
ncbi:apolipoprotein N-acyltransferase [Actinoplanes sp. ATCC 53533]|uniref:apolipoprotein N-acyltransferase n=1 Tax=Actinoplanes sp. ATCC 53533 TaxID=1288362 RepID=UPI000F79D083|nr:apolipoprotein N-acyltransferase [Actinoplanes sp. ATCC 53533]RSM71643.1 apolipoprotein N-acyltransferase [Actinoplanes sp. ATCC 53533]